MKVQYQVLSKSVTVTTFLWDDHVRFALVLVHCGQYVTILPCLLVQASANSLPSFHTVGATRCFVAFCVGVSKQRIWHTSTGYDITGTVSEIQSLWHHTRNKSIVFEGKDFPSLLLTNKESQWLRMEASLPVTSIRNECTVSTRAIPPCTPCFEVSYVRPTQCYCRYI